MYKETAIHTYLPKVKDLCVEQNMIATTSATVKYFFSLIDIV